MCAAALFPTATRALIRLRVAPERVRAPVARRFVAMSAKPTAAQPAPELRFVTSVPTSDDSSPLVLLGAKQALLAAEVLTLVPELARPVWASLVDAASSSADNGGSSTTWVPSSSGGKPRKVVCVALPSSCSRHNSPAQPHAVSTLLGGMLGSDSATVVLVVPPAHALATSVAVARALPVFTAKTKAASSDAEAKDQTRGTVTAALVTEACAPAVSPATLAAVQAAADGVRFASRLVDTPPEEMTTTHMRREARAVADALASKGVTFTEIVGMQLRDGGFGGIWGVGKAAVEAPALVVLSYTPPPGVADATLPGMALVGKGIIFDTGGLSLKVGGSMVGMKCDMAGAAGMLAAFQAGVMCGVPRPLHCLLCLAENAIGPSAVRNDDILRLFSGKTVEINNTDAEGRLVLGDGVAYASQKLPGVGCIVDMATLTGAQLVATGKRHAAVVANTEEMEAAAVRAGLRSGDLCHPLPFAPEFYRGEFASKVADMRNSVKDRSNAQSSCAANFVAEHLSADYKGEWLHIDMAGPGWINDRGTGFGVALLMDLMGLPALK